MTQRRGPGRAEQRRQHGLLPHGWNRPLASTPRRMEALLALLVVGLVFAEDEVEAQRLGRGEAAESSLRWRRRTRRRCFALREGGGAAKGCLGDLGALGQPARRQDHVAVTRLGSDAEALQASILEEVRQLRVTQGGLAKLHLAACAEHVLDVGQGDAGMPPRRGLPQPAEATAERVPRGEGVASAALARTRVLVESAVVLPPGVRPDVGQQHAVRVAEDLPLRDRQLHDVADLAQRVSLQERELHLHQHLGASEAAARECPTRGRCGEVARDLLPQLLRILVDGAVDVDEHGGTAGEQSRPIRRRIRLFHVHAGASLARGTQLPEVDLDVAVAENLR
mmetsp:Transcript_54928/g.158957  ORF Transcript_54928/g.158957 Transcript_54928/m.158957 type:complete len:338 (-) Transcript_54928:427-1440(-)